MAEKYEAKFETWFVKRFGQSDTRVGELARQIEKKSRKKKAA
jgi:hypothetical protein